MISREHVPDKALQLVPGNVGTREAAVVSLNNVAVGLLVSITRKECVSVIVHKSVH